MKKKCSSFISAQAGRPFLLAVFIMVTLGLALALAFSNFLCISSTSAYALSSRSSSSVIPSAAAAPDSAPSPSSPYSPEEFVRRRLALMELVASSNLSATANPAASPGSAPGSTTTPATTNSLIILFAAPSHTIPAGHFRQDNDFYYFTGCEDADAILVMMPASKDALLFVPEKSAGEKSFEGPNSLDDPAAKERLQVRSIMPLSSFDEFLARLTSRPQPVLYLRLSPADTVSDARYEAALFQARRARNPYNAELSLDQFRADRLRRLYPS
ncbi:MAG: hypothetical protein GYA53_01850, partial [Acidobacteria bacterium]|nr:hypothetical protein [Acidobacteriota bacterium]